MPQPAVCNPALPHFPRSNRLPAGLFIVPDFQRSCMRRQPTSITRRFAHPAQPVFLNILPSSVDKPNAYEQPGEKATIMGYVWPQYNRKKLRAALAKQASCGITE
jgi:hypothetical protein